MVAMDDLLKNLLTFPFNTIIFFIVPLLFLSNLIHALRRRLPYPPGPKGWPIIGNMNMMDKINHRGLAGLAKIYGGIFHMRMGNAHMVTVSSPEIARQVLQVQDSIFSNRAANKAVIYLTYDRADMAFAHYGPFWRQMRKLSVMKLFSRKRAESWTSVRDEVELMIKTVASQAGEPVNVGELIFTLTMNITYKAAFGSTNEMQVEFVEILQEFSKLFGAFNMADFISWLGWIDPSGLNKRLVKARNSLDRFIDLIIDEHIKKRNESGFSEESETDMVDDLLAFYSTDKASVIETDDLQNSMKLTRDNIKAIIMDVMFGGTETVASAIEWALAELLKSPEDLRKVQEEMDEVVGLDRRANERDLDTLTFLNCAVKETLRLHPPIPLLLHETAEDAEVAGYFIPARTRVMINAWAIARDGDFWREDPDTFRPSRFLDENTPDFRGNHFQFIPFGSGRRSCPGLQFGLYSLYLAVTHLLHCFTWELPDGMKPDDLDMNDLFGLTAPRASRLVAVPTTRLSCSL